MKNKTYNSSIKLSNDRIVSLHIVSSITSRDSNNQTLSGSIDSYTSDSVLECIEEDNNFPKAGIFNVALARNSKGANPVKTSNFVIENFINGDIDATITNYLDENLEAVVTA